jgi:catechol 2,3-dioxygenase-like lactoylglutathione lyase family enzyme
MITAIRHLGLVVNDIEHALHFWCDVLGFRVVKQMDESGPHIDAMLGLLDVHLTTVKLAAPDGNILELLRFHSHPDQPRWNGTPHSTGFTHIALKVEAIDELLPQLAQEGVSFPAAPQYSPDGSAKVIYAKGPEGILLELVEIIKP